MAQTFQSHLRNTFLAGIFAVIPIALTVFIFYKLNEWTSDIPRYLFGRSIPFVGVIITIVGVYLVGLAATISAGKLIIRAVDSILTRVPGLRQFYIAWKQIVITPGGTEGVFSKVVLIPDETGATHLLGFTCGRSIDGDPDTLCVFVPAAPNPINGRLYFVHRKRCLIVNLSTEEAFKVVLSTGNYVPPELGDAMKQMTALAMPGDPDLA